jgi:hypothetical protein
MNTEPQGDRYTFEIGFILSITLIALLTIGSCSVERMVESYCNREWIPATEEEGK